MKKILILFLISVFTMSGTFATIPGYTGDPADFEFDIDNYTDTDTGEIDFGAAMVDLEANDIEPTVLIPVILEGDAIENISFGDIIPVLDEASITAITETLEEEGYDAEDIASTLDVVEALGNGDTIAEIKEADPEAFAIVEDAIVSAIASEAAESLMPAQMRADMEESLNMAGTMIGVLNGFAQSTANSSVSSSLFGYQGYKLFTASVGMLGSFSVPTPLDTANTVMDISNDSEADMLEELEDLGIEAGVTIQAMSASFGLNFSWLVDGLYLGAVLGSTEANISTVTGLEVLVLESPVYESEVEDMPVEIPEEIPSLDLHMSSSIYGLKLNYQFVKGFGIPILFRWNGLNFGTGLIFNTMDIGAELDLSSTLELPDESLGAKFNISAQTTTIPLEISTGIQLLSILTVTAGGGLDIQFGSSNVEFDLITSGSDNIGTKIMRQTIDELLSESTLTFPYSGEGEVEFVNPRINIGVGVGLGPIILDVSAFYYINTGLALGANVIIRI